MEYLYISKKILYYFRIMCSSKRKFLKQFILISEKTPCLMATTTSLVNRHSTSIINCGFCVMSHSSQIIQLSISLQKTDRNSGKTTICQCIQLQQSKYDSYIRFINTILNYGIRFVKIKFNVSHNEY